MAGTAGTAGTPGTAGSYLPAVARSHALPQRRAHGGLSQHLLLIAAAVAFLVSAAALIGPQIVAGIQPLLEHTRSAGAAPSLAAAELETVLAYVEGMHPDDQLVQVRSGVFAKRSNVSGVDLAGRTVYYDLLPHQSFGPLRAGKVTEAQVDVLARVPAGNALILVYTLK